VAGPKAPAHLKANTKKWWLSVLDEYELEGHHIKILTLAAEAWDRCQEARETILAQGAYFNDRFDCPKAHPAIAVERDSRIAFARLIRELCLDIEAPKSAGRPPGLY